MSFLDECMSGPKSSSFNELRSEYWDAKEKYEQIEIKMEKLARDAIGVYIAAFKEYLSWYEENRPYSGWGYSWRRELSINPEHYYVDRVEFERGNFIIRLATDFRCETDYQDFKLSYRYIKNPELANKIFARRKERQQKAWDKDDRMAKAQEALRKRKLYEELKEEFES